MSSIQALEYALPGAFRRWVRTGLWVGTVAYAVGIVTELFTYPEELAYRIPEVVALLAGLVGLALAGAGRARTGAVLFLSAAFVEIHASFFLSGIVTPSVVYAPVVVVGLALFLGIPGAAWGAGLSVLLSGLATGIEVVATGVVAVPLVQWIYLALATLAIAVMMALGVHSFAQVAERAEGSRARAEGLVANAPDGIVVVDADGAVVEANPAAERILASPGDPVGRRLDDLGLRRPGGDHLDPARLDARPTAAAVWAEGRARRHVEVTANPLPGLDDVPRRQIMLRDVTGRIEAETRERAIRVQLQRSQRLEALAALAGGLAHDFNNLLTVIRGSAELLGLDGDESQRQLARDILEAEARGAALIRQLLAFARQGTAAPGVVRPAEVVRDMWVVLGSLVGERYRLQFDVTGSAEVRADAHDLEQAVVNLVQNALDAMPEGGTVTVRVSDAPGEAGGPAAVELSVADTGQGMAPEVESRIFEPFFTTKPFGAGSGLGLSTVYGIVDQAGGTIEVDTGPGRGTTVTIHWPTAVAEPAPSA